MADANTSTTAEQDANGTQAAPSQPPAKPEKSVDEIVSELSKFPIFMKDVPEDIEDNPHLLALQNLVYDGETPESLATYHKNEGNKFFQKGPNFYKKSIEQYTLGIEQKSTDKPVNSLLYSNRAAVQMVKRNYGHVVNDCTKAIEHDPTNIKAYWRAAKASYELEKWEQGYQFVVDGLTQQPANAELIALQKLFEPKLAAKREQEAQKKQEQETMRQYRKALQIALDLRAVVMGENIYQLSAIYEGSIYVDENRKLHWPVMLLYPEYSQSDFLRDVNETETLGFHLQNMFGPSAERAEWDADNKYKVENLIIYAETNACRPKEPAKVRGKTGFDKVKRAVEIPLDMPLAKALRVPGYIVPGVPVFHVMVRGSGCHTLFLKQYE
eukprot:GILK01005647.1.p1 GENE.GILK01005647.1~~GILK01005647.1.p1  ORF type:complete len:383 (-),score=79.84 GILK01005647.1:129-1277(-)